MGRFFTLLIFTAFGEKCFKSFFAPALVTMDQVKLVPSRGFSDRATVKKVKLDYFAEAC